MRPSARFRERALSIGPPPHPAVATAALVAGAEASAASFTYSYSNPFDANADDCIRGTSTIRLYPEGTVRVWIPETGGATFATTNPGVIV